MTSLELDFDVEARLKDGQSAKIIAVKDDMCEWVTLEQGGRSDCPPQNGAAIISAGLILARGWVMEVGFSVYWWKLSVSNLLTRMAIGYVCYRSETYVGESDAHACWSKDCANGSGYY